MIPLPIAVILSFSVGFLASKYVSYRAEENLIEAHLEEIKSTFTYAYKAGWDGANASPGNVFKQYKKIFE